jgi:hypothetical protein
MEKRRRRAQLVCTIAVVLGLHLTIVWMLVSKARIPPMRAKSQRLEFVFIAPLVVSGADNSSGGAKELNSPRSRNRAAKMPPATTVPPSDLDSNAIHPPPDWAAELSRAARDAASDQSAPHPRDFGFPHSPATPDKPDQFGWDYAATHRVEALDHGGLLVHINDNCVLILFPLPFVACGIGKRSANGDLFEHMRDR